MLDQSYSLLRFCLVTILVVTLGTGCRRKEPVTAANIPQSVNESEPVVKGTEYKNDLDRLEQLTERINRACRASYVVVLGTSEPSVSGGTVSVDYGLFDKLSDDGAAVLIAEAIAVNSMPPPSSQVQVQTNAERNVLQADETAGRYIVRAGFGSTGFAEWLEAKNSSTIGLQQNIVPEKLRIAAFMRGYMSERSIRRR